MADFHKSPDWSERLDRIETGLTGDDFLAFKHLRALAQAEIARRSRIEWVREQFPELPKLLEQERRAMLDSAKRAVQADAPGIVPAGST